MANDDPEGAEMALDDETYHYLLARAEARGRSISDQLAYELKINRGLCASDPGDTEGRERAEILRRILPSRRYRGHPLLG